MQKFGSYKITRVKFIPYLFTAAIVLISYFIIQSDQFKIFLSSMIVGPVYWVYRSYVGPIISALVLLLSSLIALIIDDRIIAHELAIYSFWLLLVGTVLLILKSVLENKQRGNTKLSTNAGANSSNI